MRFARLGEEVFERRKELQPEEFNLYGLIVLHSVPDDSGIRVCRKTIKEICELWDLEYHNTLRRYKRLRTGEFSKGEKPKKVEPMKSPWLKKTRAGIIPLVGFSNEVETDFEAPKTRKNTKPPAKPLAEKRETNAEKRETNGHQSIFSIEEIEKYVEVCRRRGDKIHNPKGLAITLHRDGNADAFIQAMLYPEPAPKNEPEFDEHGLQILDDTGRAKALELLVKVFNDDFEVEDFRKYYREEDWQWLMNQLNTMKAGQD